MDDFANALESVFQGTATVLYRMRLSCSFYDKDGKKIGDDGQGRWSRADPVFSVHSCSFFSL